MKGYRSVTDTARREWHSPEAILAQVGLKPGVTMVDIGCGDGYYALPAARIVGPEGRIYGLDIDADAVAALAERASAEGLENLILKSGKAEDTVLCKACADIAFFGIDLHDFEDPARVLLNARDMLKPAGRLADLDWKKIETGVGPPVHIRFTPAEATKLIETAGFTVENISDAGPYHYLIVARLLAPQQ